MAAVTGNRLLYRHYTYNVRKKYSVNSSLYIYVTTQYNVLTCEVTPLPAGHTMVHTS